MPINTPINTYHDGLSADQRMSTPISSHCVFNSVLSQSSVNIVLSILLYQLCAVNSFERLLVVYKLTVHGTRAHCPQTQLCTIKRALSIQSYQSLAVNSVLSTLGYQLDCRLVAVIS